VIASVAVIDYPTWPAPPLPEADLVERARERLGDIDTEALAVPVQVVAARGRSKAHGLHELADEVGAELIVVGSSHRGPVGRVVPGSTGDRLLQEAPCAVAIAPAGYAGRSAAAPEVVAAAVDGSVESHDAARTAADIATKAHAQLRLITAVRPPLDHHAPPIAGATYRDTLEERQQRAEEMLAGLRESLPTPLPVENLVMAGDPVVQLARAADRVDLLVLGSRGYGPIGRALAGSVSGAVVRRVDCPVVIVPRAVAKEHRAHGGRTVAHASS
jgi:nucleotide-binding universal stress UspA family protein